MLPLCDISLSVIQEVKRLPYYSEVEKWPNIYAFRIDIGGSYGHGLKPVKRPEVVCNYGCIVRGGVQDVTSGAIYCRWWMGAV